MTSPFTSRLDRYRRRVFRIVLALSCCGISNAFAQLRLPATPSLPTSHIPLNTLERTLSTTSSNALAEIDSQAKKNLRALQIRELLRAHPHTLEADPNGALILRHRLVAISPSAQVLVQIQSAGFAIIDTHKLSALDIEMVTLAVPAGMSTASALTQLRTLDPSGEYDFNHIYLRSGETESMQESASAINTAVTSGNPVGLIDSGIEREHSVFHHSIVHTWGCNDRLLPTAHGTAVASLMVGDTDRFLGVAPRAPLFAADIYCGEPDGGNVTTIAAACSWLAQQRVPVINISLVGPSNLLLKRAVENLQQRGHVLVAAVGNDGPAAPPLYPAAYPGVIGVTGVDARDRVLIEAGRGEHVSFAAPGAFIFAATLSNTFTKVRGTSFAAPVVAGLLSRRIGEPDRDAAAAALTQLRADAINLGPTGRDDIYGDGLIGKEIRITTRRE
jgi:subtilisin family serine protease